MCLFAAHLLQCQSSLSPSEERSFTFVFLYSIIMAVNVSLDRPQASCICSIFPLCMESKALEKSTNNIVASRILHVHLQEFDEESKFVTPWIYFSESHFGSS